MIEVSELGPLEPLLGRGATAVVYKVDYRIPNDPRPLVFKELLPDIELRAAGFAREPLVRDLTNAVQLRLALSLRDRKDLDKTFAWPLDLVHSGGRTVGLLMPLIPGEYFAATNYNGQPGQITRDLGLMIAADNWASTMGIDRSAFTDPLDRILILINLASAIAWLHKHRIVYGDLSLKNAVFSPTSHNVLLLDCDGTASLDDPQRRQLNSPYFHPPEFLNKAARLQDTRTDVYKLALCIVRGLQPPSRNAMHATNPEILKPLLGAGAVAELRLALDSDPDKRPTAEELRTVLAAHYDAHVPPTVIDYFYALCPSVPSGGDVVLLWDVANHDRHDGILHTPDGARHRVDLADGRAQVTISLSGTVQLDVVSLHGSVVGSQSQRVQVLDEKPETAVTVGDIS